MNEKNNFELVESKLAQLASPGIRPGLARLARLLSEAGSPQGKFPIVHIVGTNGKGSTAAGIYSELLYLPAGGSAMPASHESVEQRQHYIKMTGKELFKLAVNGMVDACRTTMQESGVKSEDVTWVIPHQANMRIIGAVAQRLTIPEERVFVNIDKYGNTSAASIGICLDELCRSGKIKRGDYILLTAFGGGLTWGAMLIRW